MLSRIMAFFSEPKTDQAVLTVDEAAAVLLIEVMMADSQLDERERECITQILSRRLNTAASDVEECLNLAMSHYEQSNDIYQFTRVINDAYSEEQRYEVVEDMWRVAFADGDLDKYEDHRIRRVCELLHLHHSHFIRAKSAAMSS